MSDLVLFCSCFFRPFSIAITLLGKDRANLCAFCSFVRFAIVWFCLLPLPLDVWEGLRLVFVAFPLTFLLPLISYVCSIGACLNLSVSSTS